MRGEQSPKSLTPSRTTREAAQSDWIFHHGTPDERTWEHGAAYGLHVGTEEAAHQALNARIGRPLEGKWDGTREYGKTLLSPYQATGAERGGEARYPTGSATYSGGAKVPMDARPNVFPVRITGPMIGHPANPVEDDYANSRMHGQITRGNARSGYFYRNVGEDNGSISAAVPSAAHLERVYPLKKAVHASSYGWDDDETYALNHPESVEEPPSASEEYWNPPHLYHGTSAELRPGDMAEGGHPSNFDKPKGRLDHGYATPHVSTAADYAETAAHRRGGHPRVYEVDRAHDMLPDPETGAAFGISSETLKQPDWRSKSGFRVLRELHPSEFEHHLTEDWPRLGGHTASRTAVHAAEPGSDHGLPEDASRLGTVYHSTPYKAGFPYDDWMHVGTRAAAEDRAHAIRPKDFGLPDDTPVYMHSMKLRGRVYPKVISDDVANDMAGSGYTDEVDEGWPSGHGYHVFPYNNRSEGPAQLSYLVHKSAIVHQGREEYERPPSNPAYHNIGYENRWGREHLHVVHEAAWTPSSGIFGPTTGLDPHLFDEDGELRGQVRHDLMTRLDQCLRVDSGLAGSDWQEWLHVYLAGGSASEWAGARPNDAAQDLDVIVAIDLAEAQGYSSFEGMSAGEAASALNAAFWKHFNTEGWQPEFGGTWNLTAFCNQRAVDITAIHPYAAYDVTGMRWAVKPPHLPEHSLADFSPALVAEARAVAAQARAILRLDEPMRTREARSLWEKVHADRSRAFSDGGEGWQDAPNVIEKWLAYAPHGLLGKIRDLAMAKTASAQDYRIDHQAPGPGHTSQNGSPARSVPYHEVTGRDPEDMVDIYRGVPSHVSELNPGDWVSLHGDWTRERGEGNPDSHVLHARVPARHVYLDDAERDDDEAGYHGPAITATAAADGTDPWRTDPAELRKLLPPDWRGPEVSAKDNPPCHYCGDPLDDEDVRDDRSAHEECDDMRWCEPHQEHHDDPGEAEDHNETYTDWGDHLPFEGGIHRGITVRLPPEVHSVVHDESRPHAERAGALAGHLRENPADDSDERGHAGGYGLHWTDHEPIAQAWGTGEGAMFGPSEEQRHGRASTHVVMHAASPHEDHIEADPHVLSGRNLLGYDHARSEREVPLLASAPVHLTGISWKRGDEQEWNRHDFGEVTPKTAAWQPDTSGSDNHGVYLRFGAWPHDERSFSGAGGYHEEGVSAYDLDREGDPSIGHGLDRTHEHDEYCDLDDCRLNEDDPGNDPQEEMRGRVRKAERNRDYGNDKPSETGHLVRGEMSGVGYDGEPLLKNVKRVGDWIDHRHLFLDQAGPHRLARHPLDEDYEEPEEKPPYGYRNRTAAAQNPDRYVTCGQGHEHWGALGAAGLLVRHRDGDSGPYRYLLQKRSPHVQHGGTWSTPGGALQHGEGPEAGALREASEEGMHLPPDLVHHHTFTDDHGDWAYHTVVMDSPRRFNPEGSGESDWESEGHRWVTPQEAQKLKLHPGFASSWDKVRKSGAVQKTADRREDQLAAMDPHSRASAVAQENTRLLHPRVTRPLEVKNGQGSAVMSAWLGEAGHPGSADAYVTAHYNPGAMNSCTGRGPDGEPVVALHPDRWDYGTMAHETAHLITDHQTGRLFGHPHGPDGAHDEHWAGNYAGLLDKLSPGAGRDFLAIRETRKPMQREASLPQPPQMPPRQQEAHDEPDFMEYRRKALDVARNPEPGTVIWRSEQRGVGEDPHPHSVGIHWTVKPEQVIHRGDQDGRHTVVYQGRLHDPDSQAIPRSHPMWGGRHRSMDSEAEVRLRPGASVHVEGTWVPSRPSHTPKPGGEPWEGEYRGNLNPLHPERMDPGNWEWHPVGHEVPVRHAGQGAADYSDVGIEREAARDGVNWDPERYWENARQLMRTEDVGRLHSQNLRENTDGVLGEHVPVTERFRHGSTVEDWDRLDRARGTAPRREENVTRHMREHGFDPDYPVEIGMAAGPGYSDVLYDGHNRYSSAKDLGISHIPVHISLSYTPESEWEDSGPAARKEAAAASGVPQRPKRAPGSAMVYLDVPHGTVEPYEGQEGGHHVALAYLPRSIGDEDFERVKDRAREAAARHAPMKATVGGGEVFPPGTPSDRRRVAVVPVHAPGIHELHGEFSEFDRAHYETYTPHVTRAQLGGHQVNPPSHPEASFPVTHVHVRRGDEVHSFPLTGPSRTEAARHKTASGVPFTVAPERSLPHDFLDAYDNGREDELPQSVRRIPISKIKWGHQSTLDPGILDEYEHGERQGDFLPEALQVGPHYHLNDGHHRVQADHNTGRKTIRATVFHEPEGGWDYEDEDHMQREAAAEEEPKTYYHVSYERFPRGTMLRPEDAVGRNFDDSSGEHVYMTDDEDNAERYRYHLWEKGYPEQHKYEVRPTGPVEPDPNDDKAVRTRHPVEVTWHSDGEDEDDWFHHREAVSGYDGLTGKSGMIYLDLPPGTVRQVPGGVDDSHITLVYLGKNVSDEAFEEACRRTKAAAAKLAPMDGVLRGIDVFPPSKGSDGKVVAFVPAYVGSVGLLRRELEDLSASEHTDWRPHVTLAYLEEGDGLPAPHPAVPLHFDRVHVKRGDDIVSYPLGGAMRREAVAGDLVDVYHHTTPESAREIWGQKHFEPFDEYNRVYGTNLPPGATGATGADYGDAAVHLRVPRSIVHQWPGRADEAEHYYDIDADDIRPEHFARVVGPGESDD